MSLSFPLDSDLTDLVLTTLADLRSLESFVLSSKFVYNVFDNRRSSVLRAVMSNLLGPTIPAAMRLLTVMMNIDYYWHGVSSPVQVEELPWEEDFQSNDVLASLSMRQAHQLAANHAVVCELEALYSWRRKDPRSCSSRLTPDESERFQTALYRMWFVCTMYGSSAPANRVDFEGMRSHRTQRWLDEELIKCMRNFSPTQIVPLSETWAFVSELAWWSISSEVVVKPRNLPEFHIMCGYLVWSGPRTTLQAFRCNLASIDLNTMYYERHFNLAFTRVKFPEEPTVGILTSPNETFLNSLTCRQCDQGHTFGSWSECNWSYFRGVAPPSEFYASLKFTECTSYINPKSLREICENTPYAQLIGQVFAARSEAYIDWKPEHWICTGCLKEFIRNNLETCMLSMPRQVDR